MENTHKNDSDGIDNIDESFLNWRNTLMYVLGFGMDKDGRKKYEKTRDHVYKEHINSRCEEWKRYLFKNSPSVKFIAKHLDSLKSGLSLNDILCVPCDGMKTGWFDPPKGIFLCQNKIWSKSHMEDTLVHEMIHAHHACTEIRATSLSGECRWWREFKNGTINTFRKHHQECVKRRAILSVMGHPACKDMDHAKQVVMQVFEPCFADTRPYDEIY
ncbi:hypothetical protein MERGE_002057 [Pneumocystis wakefieldiae]|uniref:Mitochondrial inner membrane protease ATP23 n=1 Tax=Pneumocystis wakefieldiae TaxID=38082 RepID=A0A899FWT5_9ASCO|nr:hypothetical protein MERGE_002057 [Pneumocystis wakefieldiae]